MISEVINGALHRQDAELFASQTSFGFIPAGTSNSLYASIAYKGHELNSIASAAFVVVKDRRTKIDLTELSMQYSNQKHYMLSGFNYANVDESVYNSGFKGTLSYTLNGIRNVIADEHYDAKLSFKGTQMVSLNQQVQLHHHKI